MSTERETMDTFQTLFAELYELPFPKGIPWDDITIHAEVDEYAAYIIGFTSRYLKGKKIDLAEIKINKHLCQRLDRSIEVLIELRNYKRRHDELVKALLDVLSAKQ